MPSLNVPHPLAKTQTITNQKENNFYWPSSNLEE